MATLAYLKAYNTHLSPPPLSFAGTYSNSKSYLSTFLQGQGPVGSMLRIVFKLHQMTVGRLLNAFSQDTLFLLSKEKQDELKGKAIKLMDLLQHSAELGNLNALFALAQISLVCHI